MKVISIKDLLDAGIHFGHRTNRWNPKMSDFIFGHRNGIHIIDLQQTLTFFNNALKVVEEAFDICYKFDLQELDGLHGHNEL